MDGCTFSQAPVLFARHSRHAPWTGPPVMVAVRAYSTRCALHFRTVIRPSWRQAKWSAVWNSTWPLSAATRCPVMKYDAILFPWAVSVESIRASPAYFTGSQVTPLSGAPSPNPSKRAGKKVSRSDFSTGPKVSPMPVETLCTNAHSCWSDFCSLA